MQHKTLAYWIVGVVGIVLIGLIIYQIKHDGQNDDSTPTNQTQNQGSSNDNATSTTSTPVSTGTSKANNNAYNAALAIYQKSGYRFQFSSCHGTPGTMAIAVGNKYMLDNRDAVAHTIKVGPYSYKLAAYGYAVVTATNKGINNITCDGGGAAQLNIQ